MTPAEASVLLNLASTWDSRTVGEVDARGWADLLHDLPLSDCLDAVKAHYGNSRERLMPSDVRQRVRAARETRIPATPPLPAHDPDDVGGWLDRLRAEVRAAAEGRPPRPELPAGTHRPVAESVANAARAFTMPAPSDRGWRAVTCPHCGARPGKPCTQPHRRSRVIPGKSRAVKVPMAGAPRDGFREVTDPETKAVRVELVPLEQAEDGATRTVQVPPTVVEIEHRPRRLPHPARVEAARQTHSERRTA